MSKSKQCAGTGLTATCRGRSYDHHRHLGFLVRHNAPYGERITVPFRRPAPLPLPHLPHPGSRALHHRSRVEFQKDLAAYRVLVV